MRVTNISYLKSVLSAERIILKARASYTDYHISDTSLRCVKMIRFFF